MPICKQRIPKDQILDSMSKFILVRIMGKDEYITQS